MLLSEYISTLQRTLDLYGDAPIYQLGECGEHYEPGYIERNDEFVDFDEEKDECHYKTTYYYF